MDTIPTIARIERSFNRLRGKSLGLTPLYLASATRIKGLVRLLSIALRVLCLVEFSVREALRLNGETLPQLYAGNPKRTTARPTTERLLAAFTGLTLIVFNLGQTYPSSLTPLNSVQVRILALMGFPEAIYHNFGSISDNTDLKMSEP